MTLRIEKRRTGALTVLRLIGQLRCSEIQELGQEIGGDYSDLALDLEELNIVDLSGIQFLLSCETRFVTIHNCPAYVREWMKQERGRSKEEQNDGYPNGSCR